MTEATARRADRDWCAGLLPAVSRTFALSIEALPAELRDAVRTAYLLCRLVDCIEDAASVEPDARARLFACFDRTLGDDGADPRSFEDPCAGLLAGLTEAEQRLCAGSGAVFRSFRALPAAPRAAIRPHVLCMSSGMREYSARGGARGELRLGDLPDLERYCYFVAGTVGELLTELFLAAVPMPDAARRAQICMRAVPFGLGLQLVNIVKDVAKDHARGVCYLPERLAAEQGVPLGDILLPERREAGMAVLRRLCARAREHLAEAEEYTLAWPLPAGAPVRLFCAVPLALALATLAEVERGTDALVPGRSPKVSRALVAEILGEAAAAGADDEALRRMLARWRGGG